MAGERRLLKERTRDPLVVKLDGVRAVRNFAANKIKVNRDRPGVEKGQHQSHRLPLGRACSAQDVGPDPALIAWCRRTAAALCPDARQRALLSDARFVLEKQADCLARMCISNVLEAFSEPP